MISFDRTFTYGKAIIKIDYYLENNQDKADKNLDIEDKTEVFMISNGKYNNLSQQLNTFYKWKSDKILTNKEHNDAMKQIKYLLE